jgi:integrase/recombinase XerD
MGRLRERRDPIVLPADADIAWALAQVPPAMAALARAALATGARQAELLAARRADVDFGRRQWTIVGKGRRLRVIDLDPFGGADILRALPVALGCPYVFWQGAPPAPYKNFASGFAAAMRRAAAKARREGREFRPFRFHDLRHAHAVMWLRSGRSIYDLQHRLGHASLATTEVYLRYLTAEEERAAKAGAGAQAGTKAGAGRD